MNNIQELRNKHENLLREREEERVFFEEKERRDSHKYADLEKKYKELVVRSQEFQVIQSGRENEVIEGHSRSLRENKIKENQIL